MGTGQPFLATGSAVSLSLSGLTIRVRYPTPAADSPPPAAGDPGRRPRPDRALRLRGRRARGPTAAARSLTGRA